MLPREGALVVVLSLVAIVEAATALACRPRRQLSILKAYLIDLITLHLLADLCKVAEGKVTLAVGIERCEALIHGSRWNEDSQALDALPELVFAHSPLLAEKTHVRRSGNQRLTALPRAAERKARLNFCLPVCWRKR